MENAGAYFLSERCYPNEITISFLMELREKHLFPIDRTVFASKMQGKRPNMKQNSLLLFLFAGLPFFANSDDEAAIRTLEDRFVAAFNKGDIDAIMANYAPGNELVVFDVVPRKQYRGADAYRKDWQEFFSHFAGTPKISIHGLNIIVDGNTGFGYSFQQVTGTDAQGQPVDRWVRVTDGYKKIAGKWLIALEHVSVPVDLKTGKAVPLAKP
jgi:ketosteroid isomerase-like protein